MNLFKTVVIAVVSFVAGVGLESHLQEEDDESE